MKNALVDLFRVSVVGLLALIATFYGISVMKIEGAAALLAAACGTP